MPMHTTVIGGHFLLTPIYINPQLLIICEVLDFWHVKNFIIIIIKTR